ncbi:cyclic nucleotide-binding domain-containing protein [Leptolyngbya sp. AN02str]|uniref:cyclic nucleotide-binding domain-containing protein n=1 Tax=Leptolyngbya sp. AN02str TaxID=3423363 RepID=UPI003D323A63
MKKVLFLLGELNDADLDWLVEVGKKEEVPAGTILIHEGRPVDTLYILLDGTLVVSISALEGRQIARLSSGDVVGEMSFIDSQPPSATVQTLENSMVLAIPRSLLSEKLQQDEGFGCRFYRALAILLSHRLRGTVKTMGAPVGSAADAANPDAQTPVEPTLHVAQRRFERLLNQVETASS